MVSSPPSPSSSVLVAQDGVHIHIPVGAFVRHAGLLHNPRRRGTTHGCLLQRKLAVNEPLRLNRRVSIHGGISPWGALRYDNAPATSSRTGAILLPRGLRESSRQREKVKGTPRMRSFRLPVHQNGFLPACVRTRPPGFVAFLPFPLNQKSRRDRTRVHHPR